MDYRLIITLKQNLRKRYAFPFSWVEKRVYRLSRAAHRDLRGMPAGRARTRGSSARPRSSATRSTRHSSPRRLRRSSRAPSPQRVSGVGSLRVGLRRAGSCPPKVWPTSWRPWPSPRSNCRYALASPVTAPEGGAARRARGAQAPPRHLGASRPPRRQPARRLVPLARPARTPFADDPRVEGAVRARAGVKRWPCAVPVVGSTSGFIPEFVTGTGGGAVYSEGDVAELAETILEVGGATNRGDANWGAGGVRASRLATASTRVAERLVGLVRSVARPPAGVGPV